MIMNEFLNSFSTREIALSISIVALFIYCFFKVRDAMCQVLKRFFVWGIMSLILLLALYVAGVLIFLNKLGLWNISLLKDTIIWFLFTGVVFFFSLNKAKNFKFFGRFFTDQLKVVILFEFVANLYTFPLWIELILIQFAFFLGLLDAYLKGIDDSDKKLKSRIGSLMTFVGLATMAFVLYNSIVDYKSLFAKDSLLSLLLPIWLAISTLPFYYFVAMYMEYELLFTTLKHIHRNVNKSIVRNLLIASVIYANFSIVRIGRIKKHQIFFNASRDNPYQYIRLISRPKKYIIGNNAKFMIFNDIKTVLTRLSNIGIGKLSDWTKKGVFYSSSSDLFYFNTSTNGLTENNISYLVCGEQDSIHLLSISLNIGFHQDKEMALQTFIRYVDDTLMSIGIQSGDEMRHHILSHKHYSEQNDIYVIDFQCTDYENIADCYLNIKSKLNDYSNSECLEEYTLLT